MASATCSTPSSTPTPAVMPSRALARACAGVVRGRGALVISPDQFTRTHGPRGPRGSTARRRDGALYEFRLCGVQGTRARWDSVFPRCESYALPWVNRRGGGRRTWTCRAVVRLAGLRDCGLAQSNMHAARPQHALSRPREGGAASHPSVTRVPVALDLCCAACEGVRERGGGGALSSKSPAAGLEQVSYHET